MLVFLAVSLLAGCSSYRTQVRPVPEVLAEHPAVTLRLTLAGAPRLTVRGGRVENDTLFGDADEVQKAPLPPYGVTSIVQGGRAGYRVAVPLAIIQKVERVQLSAERTVLLALGLGATAAVIILAAASSSEPEPEPAQFPASGEGFWSCPLLYSWDGSEWHLDSGTYAGAIMPALARRDVDNLDHLREADGFVRLRLCGLPGEVEHVDAVTLLAVDHDPGVTVAPDAAGGVHTVGPLVPPVRAAGFDGRDALARVTREDEWGWESPVRRRDPASDADLSDGLEIEFPRPAGAREAKLVLDATNTPWAAHLVQAAVALHGSETQWWYDAVAADTARASRIRAAFVRGAFLRVSVWALDGWEAQGLVGEAGPDVMKREVVPLNLSRTIGETVRVRLESTPNLWLIDHVAIDYTPDRPVLTQEVRPGVARDRRGRDVRGPLITEDRVDYVIAPGDTAELAFRAPPPSVGMSRSYLAVTSGWYRIGAPGTGQPDRALADRLESEPPAIARFAVARMNGALSAMATARRDPDR